MNIIRRDILADINTEAKVVVIHGCNCFHTMEAGIAKYLSYKYPQVLAADRRQTTNRDRNKLGSYSTAIITPKFHILNCYTQYFYGRKFVGQVLADYTAIRNCLRDINTNYSGCEIRSPKIGCGLAGGDWEIVNQIFNEELADQNVTIYYK